MSEQYYLSPYLFFCIETPEILVWNYSAHEQHLLTLEYFTALLEIAQNGHCDNKSICADLLEGNLITTVPISEEEWGFDKLSKIFHIGISNLEQGIGTVAELSAEDFAKNYAASSETLKTEKSSLFLDLAGEKIKLPDPAHHLLSSRTFIDVLLARKTYRSFTHQSVTLETLSTILFYSFGIPDPEPWPIFKDLGIKQTALHKTSPSGGGRHPTEAFVVINYVDGLEKGVYHYQPRDHSLTLLQKDDVMRNIAVLNVNQPFSDGLSFGVYLIAALERTWWKYSHSRAYRIATLDVGHVSQTFQLCATAAGLNTWLTGLFRDEEILKLCHLSGYKFAPMLFVGAGISDGDVLGRELYQKLVGK